MNRWDPTSLSIMDVQAPKRQDERRSSLAANQRYDDTPCVSFTPLHYEAGYAYPLVIWLHGPGDDERQLQRIMPHVSMRNFVAVGPRASGKASQGAGYAWGDSEDHALEAERRALACLEMAQRKWNIAPHRVFLGGFESGGEMAIRVAWRRPDKFAGAASFGGPLPREHAPLFRLDEARQIPLLIALGESSHRYPGHRLCEDLQLSHAAGIKLEVRQYPCGDDLLTNMLSDWNVWMMGIVTGEAEQASAAARSQYE